MKSTGKLCLAAAMALALSACNNEARENANTATDDMHADSSMAVADSPVKVVPGSYVNLGTGKKVYIIPEESTGYAYDSIAKVPVEFYINPSTNDTLDRTGRVVNHMLVQHDGKWTFDGTKVKVDGEDIKIKDGDTKVKMDDDESKVKSGDYKKKVDGDEVKIKDGDTKTKIEDGEVKKKKAD